MKKGLAFMALLAFAFGVLGCADDTRLDTPDDTPQRSPDETVDETLHIDPETQLSGFGETIGSFLPTYFNADVALPKIDGFDLVWWLNGNPYTEVLPHEAPFIDRWVQVTVEATYDGVTETFTHDMLSLSRQSPRNQNVMHIQVDVPLHEVTRSEYRNAAVRVYSHVNDQGSNVFSNNTVEIRGRGNSTWSMPKKPYRLRFADDVSILGMPEARNYVLLAEYADKSLLRNTAAYTFSSMLRYIEHAPATRFIELYVNGEYQGVYTLTEHIEIHENKLWIDPDPEELDTGFFFELDRRFYEHGHIEGVHGFNVAGVPYEIKEPSPGDDLTSAQINYLRQYIIDMENALIAQDGYENYLDIDNFIDYFIVHELFKNVDVGWGSVFAYKRPGEVLRLGPIWDFDLAIGNANYIDYGPYNWYGMAHNKNRWFHLMMDIPAVRARFRTRYVELYHTKIFDFIDFVETMGEAAQDAAERNFERWDILGHYVWPNPQGMVDATTYEGQLTYLLHHIETRAQWMYHAVLSQDFADGVFFD